MTAGILANVRKKGRPRILTAEQMVNLQEIVQEPDDSYRQFYERQRFAKVAIVLIESCNEDAITALGVFADRPKSSATFPWLLGKTMQRSVLIELYGLPDEGILAAARYLEKLHNKHHTNAKRGRTVARNFRRLYGTDVLEEALCRFNEEVH